RWVVLDHLQEGEATHVGQAEVQDHAVEPPLTDQLERLLGGGDRGYTDIVLTPHQLDDTGALCFVILHHQKVPDGLVDEPSDPFEGRIQCLLADRLLKIGKGLLLKAPLPALHSGHDMDGNVTGGGTMLQAIEHCPSVYSGQIDVE